MAGKTALRYASRYKTFYNSIWILDPNYCISNFLNTPVTEKTETAIIRIRYTINNVLESIFKTQLLLQLHTFFANPEALLWQLLALLGGRVQVRTEVNR